MWLCRGIFLCKGIILPAEGAPAKILALLIWSWWSLWTSGKNKGKRWNSHIQEERKVGGSSRRGRTKKWCGHRWSCWHILVFRNHDLLDSFPKWRLVGFQQDVVTPGESCQQLTGGIGTQARNKTQIPAFHWLWTSKWHEGRFALFGVRNSLTRLCWL